MEIVLVDMFSVPNDKKSAFLEQTNIARNVVKALPGFVEGHTYEMQDTDEQFNILTVVVWQDKTAYENARMMVAEEYQRRGFNPLKTVQEMGINMIRATYKRVAY